MILFIIALLLTDVYVLSGFRGVSKKWQFLQSKWFTIAYLTCAVLLIGGLVIVCYAKIRPSVRFSFMMFFLVYLLFKVSFVLVILMDDLRRLVLYILKRVKKQPPARQSAPAPAAIPRSEFLMKAGLLAGIIPIAALRLEMKSGLYDYHIKRLKLYLPNLPKAFDGIKVGQISDIHSGSFFHHEKAVLRGVEMLMQENADLLFFTGDLVNFTTKEMSNYQDIFSKVKAPLGVYSCLGNHDYGDYQLFPTPEAKIKDHNDLIACHKNMGWNLLMNENRRLKVDGEEIGILGVENWGELSPFPKYGRMDLTVKNTDDLPVKLLLSHDPSHWRAQVLPEYPQIDVMFSGHTHGMQLGVQTANFQWSPIEYMYKEWAGLYQDGRQQLYVNVGFGFLFPGRVGILPEITIFELKAASAPPNT